MPVVYLGPPKNTPRVEEEINKVREQLKSVLSSREIESIISAILRKKEELREYESIISGVLRSMVCTEFTKKNIIRSVKIEEFNNELQKIALRFNELMTDEQGRFKLTFMDDREDNEYNRRAYFIHLFTPLYHAVIDEYF